MASEESWIYANRTFGKFFGIAGALDLSLGVGEGLTAYDHHSHAIIYGINFLFFIFGIIFSIYLTERYLSRRYNNR